MEKRFGVVEGGPWIASPDWLSFPDRIRARSPEDRNVVCRVRVNREDALKAASMRRRQLAYDFWGILNGKAPPVPHFIQRADEGLTTLFDAHACFQGMRRPIAEDADGDGFLAYILKPKWLFRYDARPPGISVFKDEVPGDLVFVAYVKLDNPAETNATKGVLTHWHFVEADERDANLPVEFDQRYVKRLW